MKILATVLMSAAFLTLGFVFDDAPRCQGGGVQSGIDSRVVSEPHQIPKGHQIVFAEITGWPKEVRALRPGLRIRLKTVNTVKHFYGERESISNWIVGQLVLMDDDSIHMELEEGDTVSFQKDTIVRVDRSYPSMRPRTGQFALIGAALGAGVGAVVFFALSPPDEEDNNWPVHALGAAGITIAGLGLGALIGSHHKHQCDEWHLQWEKAPSLSLDLQVQTWMASCSAAVAVRF